jgi:sigma-B regulation protein RsbU (phosphoserine phosphatase)
MAADDIPAVFGRLTAGYANRNAEAIAANYAEGCVVDSPIAGVHTGRSAIARTLQIVFSAFPDIVLVPEDTLIVGDRGLWISRMEGTDTGGLMGLPATGKPFTLHAFFLFTFNAECQIVRERRVYDLSRLLRHFAGEAEPPTTASGLYLQILDQARREHELRIAADIQRALLPASRYTGAGFEVAATSVACRAIGGDFFDYFQLPRGGFAFVLGDVAGKGPPAALLASVLQGIFTANADRDGTPAGLLTLANRALVRRAIEARFATAVYAVLDRRGRLTYCNAGHNRPVLIGRRGVRRLDCGGTIIGAFEDTIFDEETHQLESGDVLLAYSDGLTEARDASGEEFGEERLLSCVSANHVLPAKDLLERVLSTVHAFSAGAAQSDDLTMLILRYSGESARSN